MKKIAFIGGGSAKFVRGNVVNLLSYPEHADIGFELCLMDIDPQRLERSRQLMSKIFGSRKDKFVVKATTDLATAVTGADFVFITIMEGGIKHYETDTTIPARYGVLQAVGDTIGPGAVMRAIRTAPVLQNIVDHVRRLAPSAMIINYANPLSMLTRILIEAGHKNTVGLCHSIQAGPALIGKWLNIPPNEIEFTAAGINHVNFYIKLEHEGRDLYPEMVANADRITREAEHWEADVWERVARGYERVRMELAKYLGHWPAEGPWHQGDFYPWFRKNRELVDYYGPKEGWAYNFDRLLAENGALEIDRILSGQEPINYDRSNDYGIMIVNSVVTNSPRSIYGNVLNDGLITNLPPEAVVEVECRVDAAGITPMPFGRIPSQLAAVMHPHTMVHELNMAAIHEKSLTLLRQAIQMDPLTGAVLTLPQIDAMCQELFADNANYLQNWSS